MNVHDFRKKMIGSMIAAAGTLGLALAAQAGETSTAPDQKRDDVVVRYADLDLNSAEGVEALYARLSAAASRACGNLPGALDIQARKKYKACFERKLDKVVGKVGNPAVQALHDERKDAAKVG